MSTAEEVRAYLADKSIQPLLKWITTELVIHKPADPLTFIHNLSKLPLTKNDYQYSEKFVADLLVEAKNKTPQEIKQEATVLNAQILPISHDVVDDAKQLNNDFHDLVDAIKIIGSELCTKKAAKIITEQTCKILNCEKSILYTIDSDTNSLIATSEDDLSSIKWPINTGIKGRVAKSGQYEIIDDVYNDPDYCDLIDKELNFLTNTLVVCPITDLETSEIHGIIEAINKKDNKQFTKHDVDLLKSLGNIGSVTLQNGILYEMALSEKKRNDGMLELWSHLNDDSKVFNLNSLLFTITRKSLQIVDAEACTFYFADHNNNQIWSLQGEVNIRMAMNEGIAGLCASTGNIINEEHISTNPKFNNYNDVKTGFITRSMLCVPMKGSRDRNNVIGVIQLLNKKGPIEKFDERDEHILELILSAAAPIIENNQLFFSKDTLQMLSPKKDEKYINDIAAPEFQKQKSRSIDFGVLIEEPNEKNDDNIDEEKKEK